MFKNVVVALDLMIEPARHVMEKAQSILATDGRLRVIHVVEPQYVQYSIDPTFTASLTHQLEKDAVETARNRLAEICEPYEITEENLCVVMGRPAEEIHEFARTVSTDVIVIGSHSQVGWRRLLGSTANSVLHGAPVDVIVTRLPAESAS